MRVNFRRKERSETKRDGIESEQRGEERVGKEGINTERRQREGKTEKGGQRGAERVDKEGVNRERTQREGDRERRR